MEFKGTQGNWILDTSDMLTIRSIDDEGNRIFIAKADTYEYYRTGFNLTIAKAKASNNIKEVEELRLTLSNMEQEAIFNAKILSKAKEMFELLNRINESPIVISKRNEIKNIYCKHWSIDLENLLNKLNK